MPRSLFVARLVAGAASPVVRRARPVAQVRLAARVGQAARVGHAVLRVAPRCRRLSEVGMATAEYAIATLAACGFAALLLTLLRSPEVRDLLFGIVKRALSSV